MIPLKEATGPLKKPIELREVEPTKAQSDDLARIYLQVVRLWRDEADRIMRGYEPSPDFIRDTVEEVEGAIATAEARANALILSLSLELDNWTRRFSSWHRKKFAQNVKTGTGVSVIEFMSNSAIQNEMKISLAWNIDLISNVSADMKRRIADIVWSGWRANEPRREISKRINEAVGIERRRALRISVDQTSKLSADLDRARMLEMGITDWVWVHSRKAHPRLDHVARNGKEYNWITNRPPDVPGQLPYCFTESQPIGIADNILMVWRRPYSGDLTEIITESGEVVRCTPNHPLLTRSGWKAAKDIKVGCDIVDMKSSGLDAFDLDVEKAQPRIDDLFYAAEAIFVSVPVHMGGSEFHGDATVNEYVDSVDTKLGLRHTIVSPASEDVVKLFLKDSFVSRASRCALEFFGETSDSTSASLVRGLRLLEALCWRQISPDDAPGLALISDIYASIFKASDERGPRHADSVRNAVGRLPALIGEDRFVAIKLLSIVGAALDFIGVESPPDFKVLANNVRAESDSLDRVSKGLSSVDFRYNKVKSVVSGAWEGHVYNLETECGWYQAGNIPAKNCGCKARPLLKW